MRFSVRVAALCAAASLVLSPLCGTAQSAPPVVVTVDARNVDRDVVHVRETIPVTGPVTIVYPKWEPGTHGPTGEVVDVVNLRVAVNGRAIAYAHDDVDLYAYHIAVPAGAASIDVSFDRLYAPRGDSTTPQLATIDFFSTIMYPRGARAHELPVQMNVELPEGWSYGTALTTTSEANQTIAFAPASLETVIDSPVLTGLNLKKISLNTTGGLNEAVLAGDTPAALALAPETVDDLKNLVLQADALFGARHWRNYHFLIALSDNIAHFGLEHHESSDDRLFANSLTDADALQLSGDLLPHEFTHSWNGKYRRPAGLATPDYQQPMQDELLWVYEGLTNYYGWVLSFRSGFRATADYPDYIANVFAGQETQPGRTTRSLVDTAIAIPVPRGSGLYPGMRRGGDYYPEGALVWMEADLLIRAHSGGKKSLDDFAKRFEGAPSTAPAVVPYTRNDVIAALNDVDPYDWKTFFDQRVDAIAPHLSTQGLEAAGWRLAYDDRPTKYIALRERSRGGLDLRYSIGAQFSSEGTITDVFAGSAAARAGLAPGMHVLAVNGKRFTLAGVRAAVRSSKTATVPVTIIAENASFVRSYAIEYHDGDRFPHLVRIDGRTDYLSASVLAQKAVR